LRHGAAKIIPPTTVDDATERPEANEAKRPTDNDPRPATDSGTDSLPPLYTSPPAERKPRHLTAPTVETAPPEWTEESADRYDPRRANDDKESELPSEHAPVVERPAEKFTLKATESESWSDACCKAEKPPHRNTEEATEALEPRRAEKRTLRELPICNCWLTVRLPWTMKRPATESKSSMRSEPRTESLWKEPVANKQATDRPLPRRAKLLRLRLLPSVIQPVTLTEELS
jgi:hypothetical protein